MELDKITWENCSDRKVASFVSSKENFNKSLRGLRYLAKFVDRSEYINWLSNDEYIYQNHKELGKFKNSKILIVCGGPSAKDLDWDVKDYDYVFSCNHFYNFDKLKNEKVDLFFLGNEVSIQSDEFLNYCYKHKPIIGVEDIEQEIKVQYLKEKFKDDVVLCSSRYQAKFTGVGGKLIIFALCLEPKQVDFVGLDGITKKQSFNSKMPHSFQDSKLFRANKTQTYEEVLSHYKLLEKYIDITFPHVIVNNLGKRHKDNCLNEINL